MFNILVGLGAIEAVRLQERLELEEPLAAVLPDTMLAMGLCYALAGIALLLPWRLMFHVGRVLLILGIVMNLLLAVGAGFHLPREFVLDYPLVAAAPGFVVGFALLEAIILFWPEERR
jgi:hypothetical protein